MYQFYYADERERSSYGVCKDNIMNHFQITAIRPTTWEEHCLECSAPLCYKNCLYYSSRSDGRCKRFENGFLTFFDKRACCGQGAHVKFRKWANMMTIIFPAVIPLDEYQDIFSKNQKTGVKLKKITNSNLPVKIRWETIRVVEYLRRRKLRHMKESQTRPDAFLFHCFSYNLEGYNFIVEIYDGHKPLYKMAIPIVSGENLFVFNCEQMTPECWKTNNLIKMYPENNLEAELDFYWCDFVTGVPIQEKSPAPKVKCVIWDLDNTLWDGTLIETEDATKLKLKEGILEVIKALDERGIIQSVASKNDYNLAWTVIERLGVADYFLYPQIHWNAKSDSVEQIAKMLNIGIDSLALIDDSIFEREQVRSVWPQVRTYDIDVISDLLRQPEFSVMVTEESKRRRIMYRAEEKRNEVKYEDNMDTVAFIKKCNLEIMLFQPSTDTELLRCYELVVRTNQLNMSGKKYTQDEFTRILKREEHYNFAFSCEDDFGEYGVVGFGQYRINKAEIIFTEFAMSCRVAGKYVESALFAELLKKHQCEKGEFKILKTRKNALLRSTLENIGFLSQEENSSMICYSFSNNLKYSDIVKVVWR